MKPRSSGRRIPAYPLDRLTALRGLRARVLVLLLLSSGAATRAGPADAPDRKPIDEAISALVEQFGDGHAVHYPRFRRVLFGNLFDGASDDAVALFSMEGFDGSNGHSQYLAFFAAVTPDRLGGKARKPYRLVAVTTIGEKMWRSYDYETAVIKPNSVTLSGKTSWITAASLQIVSTFSVKEGQITEVTEEVMGHGRDDQAFFASPARDWIRPLEDAILERVREQRPELGDQIDHLRADRYQYSDFWLVIGYRTLPDHLALADLDDDGFDGPQFEASHLDGKGHTHFYARDGKITGILIHGIASGGGSFPEDLGECTLDDAAPGRGEDREPEPPTAGATVHGAADTTFRYGKDSANQGTQLLWRKSTLYWSRPDTCEWCALATR